MIQAQFLNRVTEFITLISELEGNLVEFKRIKWSPFKKHPRVSNRFAIAISQRKFPFYRTHNVNFVTREGTELGFVRKFISSNIIIAFIPVAY